MQSLIELVNNLKESNVKNIIGERMKEFEELGKQSDNEIFKELCFCFLTANFNAKGGIRIQKEINDGFLHLSQNNLSEELARLGHRFPNARAKFIFEARKYKDGIKNLLGSFSDDKTARSWFAENIKGLGMKESSHFLRNIGYKNVAIVDFHIVDVLVKHSLIEKPKSKSLTPKRYVEIENILRELAKKTDLSLGELDLYLWYLETGQILK